MNSPRKHVTKKKAKQIMRIATHLLKCIRDLGVSDGLDAWHKAVDPHYSEFETLTAFLVFMNAISSSMEASVSFVAPGPEFRKAADAAKYIQSLL